MEFLIADIFFSSLGWCYLFIKYRDAKRMSEVRNLEFDGRYSSVGRSITLSSFLIVLGLLIIGLLIVGIIGLIIY